jgi:RIO kinase 1
MTATESNKYSRLINQYFKEEDSRKTFNQVFDQETILAVHQLAEKGLFEQVEYAISTGKEANVFRALDVAGNYRAVKIYKTKTSSFRNMMQYIEGDKRFQNIRRDKRNIVALWAQKEFKNLSLMQKADVPAPLPLGVQKNVLVMEFIGSKKGLAAKPLQEHPIEDLEALYHQLVDSVANLIEKANLIHADLSEYNILNREGKPVIIDCGQSVLKTHPNAKVFYERDVENVSNYVTKMGFEKSKQDMLNDLKEKRTEMTSTPD